MTPTDLLAHLALLGVTVTRTGADAIDLDGPSEVLTDDLVAAVRAAKPDLLALLETPRPATRPVAPGDDGQRVWIRAMGEVLGWPRILLGKGEALAAGWQSWETFITSPFNEGGTIERAIEALMTLEDE